MRWIIILLPFWLSAQRQAPLDADFRFRDGVYLSNESLLANDPDVEWSEISGEMVQLPEDFRVQIDSFGYKSGGYTDPYAISLDGLPYLFVRKDEQRIFHEFAGLRPAGRYATIRYDTVRRTRQLMRAYNPANGRPFREGWVERDRRELVRRIVDMSSGRRLPLTPANVQQVVAREEDLLRAAGKLTMDDEPKMVRALVLFNERHPLLIPLHQAPD